MANGGAIIYLLLKEFSPDDVSAYVDPMHMTVEGGLSGWEMGLELLVPWVSLVGVKKFLWHQLQRNAKGQMEFRTQYLHLPQRHRSPRWRKARRGRGGRGSQE